MDTDQAHSAIARGWATYPTPLDRPRATRLNTTDMKKDFDGWNGIKKELDLRKDPPLFKEREIWWCSIGMNVGYEIYGKKELFTRPVLILKKYSYATFFGLPLTSKRKNGYFFFPIDLKEKKGGILLDQGCTLDARRLADKISYVTPLQFKKIKEAMKESL